jgi:signal transduction histidine kinase
VVRHASATQVFLRVFVSPGSLGLSVEDDGQGFTSGRDDAQADGLRNMRQRMAEIGGEVSIESQPGVGTKITFTYRWPTEK